MANSSATVSSRGQGVYGPRVAASDGFPDELTFDSATLLGYWLAYTGGSNASATLCVSRVRPDMVSGVFRIVPSSSATSPNVAWPTDSPWFAPVTVAIRFTIPFVDHSGQLYYSPTDSYVEPEGAERVNWLYNSPSPTAYDEAWPWDEITDSAVRDAVYERYTPWNLP